MSTPRGAQPLVEPATKQPISWADIENDEDFSFNMPVQRLEGNSMTPTKEEHGSPQAGGAVKIVVTKKTKRNSPDQPATTTKNKTPLASIEESEATEAIVRAQLTARKLFSSSVEVTVDGAVPYSLKSTAAWSSIEIAEGSLTPSQKSGDVMNDSIGESPTQPATSRRIFEAATTATVAPPAAQQLPAALNMSSLTDRSHPAGRRRRAIRVIADTIVSNGGKSMPLNDVVWATKWNKTFRPGLGCLFSFVKSLPALFVYRRGEITLTYEEDIASTMLRTWSETDPQAGELENMAVSNAAALASAIILADKRQE